MIRLNQLGREWLPAFFSILRTAQVHDSENRIFDEPIRILLEKGNEVFQREGKVEFRIVDDQFFLNGLWIKPTLAEKENLFSLSDAFQAMGLGGITIRSTTQERHWRTFISIRRGLHAEVKERYREFNEGLTKAGIEQIEVHPVMELRDPTAVEFPMPPLAYAAVTSYAKGLLVLREFARCAPGEEQVAAIRKAQRIICDLVDLSEKTPRLFCALSLLKNFDSYFHHHGVNVLILSIMVAREIGVGRKELVDLGIAALMHDVGKLQIPDEILSKQGKLTFEEWQAIQRHPIESAKTFLQLGYMNDSVAERVLVAYQHHWASRSSNAYPRPRREMKPSLLAEIVAVAVTYDALTTHKNYRAGFTPWEAVRILSAQNRKGGYRTEVLNTFLRLLGPLPVGSWVEFENGEVGFVGASGIFGKTPPFPWVFVVNSEGKGHWVDAGAVDSATGHRLKVRPKRPDHQAYQKTMALLFRTCEESPLI